MARSKSAPSSFSQYAILLKKDLVQEFRTKDMLVSMGVYSLLIIIVFGVALSFVDPTARFLEVSGGLLWALIIFTSLMGLNRSFVHERENKCLEGLLLAPLDRGVIFLAKTTSNLIFLLAVEIIAVPLFWVLFPSFVDAKGDALLIALPILLGSIGIAGIGTLLSTMTMNTRGKDVMLAVLFIPIIFPLLYVCVSTSVGILAGGNVAEMLTSSLLLALGYDAVMLLISWVLFDLVVSA